MAMDMDLRLRFDRDTTPEEEQAIKQALLLFAAKVIEEVTRPGNGSPSRPNSDR